MSRAAVNLSKKAHTCEVEEKVFSSERNDICIMEDSLYLMSDSFHISLKSSYAGVMILECETISEQCWVTF